MNALLDVAKRVIHQPQLALEIAQVDAAHQVGLNFEMHLAVFRDVVSGFAGGDIDELIADKAIVADLRNRIFGDAREPFAFYGHLHPDDPVRIVRAGELHRIHHADADSVDAYGRVRPQTGGVVNVEKEVCFGLEQSAASQQVDEDHEDEQRN